MSVLFFRFACEEHTIYFYIWHFFWGISKFDIRSIKIPKLRKAGWGKGGKRCVSGAIWGNLEVFGGIGGSQAGIDWLLDWFLDWLLDWFLDWFLD